MQDKKISVLVFTYNRNDMLKHCLESLQNQTYKNFEVIILDRGSNPSAKSVVKKLNDDRFFYIRSSQEIDRVDSGNEIIKNIKGDYFVNPGDDDIYLPNAFMLIKKAFDKESKCDIVQIGMTPYVANKAEQQTSKKFINSFTTGTDFFDNNILAFNYDGKLCAKRSFAYARIGPRKEWLAPAHNHPTAIFIRSSAIKKIWDSQKGLFVKTFWDGGYSAVEWNTDICYINAPLAIFSVDHAERETTAERRRWKKECLENEHISLKIPHGLNCGADGSLKTLYRTGINREYPTYLRFQFYTDIFKDVFRDSKWDAQTYADFKEIIPAMFFYPFKNPLASLQQIKQATINFFTPLRKVPHKIEYAFIRPFVLLARRLVGYKKKSKKINASEISFFADITLFGNFIEKLFEQKYKILNNYLNNGEK